MIEEGVSKPLPGLIQTSYNVRRKCCVWRYIADVDWDKQNENLLYT